MATPVYPKALSGWTDRINNVDTVWAADPNTLAAEIISIEQTLGTMPQVETPPVGNPLTFASVSARIAQAAVNANSPYVLLNATAFGVGYGSVLGYGRYNTYKVENDRYNFFNGSDITIKARGLYLVMVGQSWHPAAGGYVQTTLSINGGVSSVDVWNWSAVPLARGAFHTYGTRYAYTENVWFGDLNVGDRIRVVSENSTPDNPVTAEGSTLRAYYLRSTAQVAPGPTAYPV